MTGESFGQAVVRLRRKKGVSQRQLALLLHIDQASLSRYEHDTRVPDREVASCMDRELNADGELTRLYVPSTIEVNPDERERVAYSRTHPMRLDGETVTELGKVLAAQRRLDDSVGPHAMITPTMSQLTMVTDILRESRGPHRDALALVVAEYVQFAGWLHAEARHDGKATSLLNEAEELAEETGDGTLVAQAVNFKGYLARQQRKPRAVVRFFLGAHHTPGAHPAQRIGDAAQAAQGLAVLGNKDEARRLLDAATDLFDTASGEQPHTAYWLTEKFQHLNLGLAYAALGDHADAADLLGIGLAGLPEDQKNSVWAVEYQRAHELAKAAR